MKALLDTNVIVDVLQKREPWFEAGKQIFLAAARNDFTGCVTAKEIADLHFFSRKQFAGQENTDEKARQIVAKIMSLFEVTDTLAMDCRSAMGIPNRDYEDAIMITSAVREKADYIVTRNPEHFAVSPVPAVSPDQFLILLEKQKRE